MLKFKKIITISICSLVAATSIVWGMKSIEPKDGVGILLDGKKLELDVEPFIENNRTLIPVRGVMEGLGADVGWDAKERLVTIDKEDIKIKLFIGSDVAIVTKEEGKKKRYSSVLQKL